MSLDLLDNGASLDLLDLLVPLDHVEIEESPDKMDNLDHLEVLDLEEKLDLRDLQVGNTGPIYFNLTLAKLGSAKDSNCQTLRKELKERLPIHTLIG